MKIVVALVILLIAVAIVFPQWLFTVDETQLVIVTRFGEPKRVITSPGLNYKTPFVESVTKFDKRLLRYDASPADLLTKDKKTLHIDAYARYRIVDVLLFFQTVRNEQGANRRVGDLVDSALREEIAKDDQVDIIKTEREAIMKRVLVASAERATEFGIEIVDVRTKRIDFLSTIQANIFARMQAERDRIAKGFRAEGEEEAAKVRADVDRQKTIILADAEKEANILRGEGEARAIEIFAGALEQDPEFYGFQRSLQAYKTFLTQNTTVVLSADSDLFRYLENPDPPSTDSESESSQ
jgi:membrane protease subunit HflC